MKQALSGYPILSCHEAAELEASILNDEVAEWAAMQRAGSGIAKALCQDYLELSPLPETFNLLALIGKGNNGGDALIACRQILDDFPGSRVTLLFAGDPDDLRPLAMRAYEPLKERATHYTIRADVDEADINAILDREAGDKGFDVCIDGLLGMSFRPPVREPMSVLIRAVNAFDRIRMRAAVDLPSGKGDTSDALFFRTDFTYATGIPKSALFEETADCGRIRVIYLGFHETAECAAWGANDRVMAEDALESLRVLRPTDANKYTYGHVFILGGSACMPGALLMSVRAAVRSGVGLVTAFAPSSVSASLAAQAPESMWVPWPENDDGTLEPGASQRLLERLDRATAVLIGPGLGRGEVAEQLVREIVEQIEIPIVLDADALSYEVIRMVGKKRKSGIGSVILTPHAGEFVRMANLPKKNISNKMLRAFCKEFDVTTVLKGPLTRICNGDTLRYGIHGGPVLSRGGSGDILAGLISGMVAQQHFNVHSAIECAVTLHGLAAERLARENGQVCVHTTQLLDYLSDVLRSSS
jgi:NAD(P)H-hydrate epimerase